MRMYGCILLFAVYIGRVDEPGRLCSILPLIDVFVTLESSELVCLQLTASRIYFDDCFLIHSEVSILEQLYALQQKNFSCIFEYNVMFVVQRERS